MIKSTRNIIVASVAIAAMLSLVSSSFMGGYFMQSQLASAAQEDSSTAAPDTWKGHPNPTLTQEQETAIIQAAMNVPGVKNWSSTGWKFVSMDFVGVTEPELQWQRAIVHLQLPLGVGDAPVECDRGWWATVDVNLETYRVEEAGFPTMENNECHSRIVFRDPDAVR